MSFFDNTKQAYKKNKYIRLVFQLMFFLLIYFSIRTWQSVDNIQGKAPVIVAVTLEGEKVDLRKYQSRPVLVHFWATWCPVCQFENSNIANLVEDYQVITIASWSETETQVKTYLTDEGLSMPVIVDEDGEWAKVYGVKAVPSSFFIDSKGVIQFVEKGYTSELGLRLRLWWLE